MSAMKRDCEDITLKLTLVTQFISINCSVPLGAK